MRPSFFGFCFCSSSNFDALTVVSLSPTTPPFVCYSISGSTRSKPSVSWIMMGVTSTKLLSFGPKSLTLVSNSAFVCGAVYFAILR